MGAAFGGRWLFFFFYLKRELLKWPAKVPRVGFGFIQTGLIWVCHNGHMVLEGAYGLREGVHLSACCRTIPAGLSTGQI